MNNEEKKDNEAASRLNDGLGRCRLLDVSLRVINTIETMDHEIQIMFTFTDNIVNKFGDETINANTGGTKQCCIRLCYGSDMRDVALGLARLAGHIAMGTTPFGTA